MRQRRRLAVRGLVQGVGFRPFVARLCRGLQLSGFVRNSAGSVTIEVEGTTAAIEAFARALATDAPPGAAIEEVASTTLPVRGTTDFTIEASDGVVSGGTTVPSDVAACEACLRELGDPGDRRHRYPFLACAHCGPRYTTIQSLPYDRERTTMAAFPLCEACRREYEDPTDRRFHAEATACPVCGPRVWMEGQGAEGDDAAVDAARARIAAGGIVAVKGLGGFHLACDATSDAAVGRLRDRKCRARKPFALMVRDLDMASRLCRVDDAERRLLQSPARPVVLLRRRREGPAVSALVAPGQSHLGLMLPYTPLHHLLAGDRPLVMTSGNVSDEPIAHDNDEARRRLAGLADAWLMHDRPIHVVCDDSVVRAGPGGVMPIRRSRGYAPLPVRVAFDVPPLLAVGGEIKAAFCLAHGRAAYLSQHIGDMGNLETLDAFERAVDHLQGLLRIEPVAVVADRHPGYLSAQWAREWAARRGVPVTLVQHHHAHLGAVMAEHGLPREARAIGLVFDGTGYGLDGGIWGGECLVGGYGEVARTGSLAPVLLPASDADVRHCHRLALAYLRAAGLAWADDLAPVRACAAGERTQLASRFDLGIGTVTTTSMGRLFDAVSSLLGVCHTATYEGQAAIELEAVAVTADRGYAFRVEMREGRTCLDAAPVLAAIVDDLRHGVPVPEIAGAFHAAVARGAVALADAARAGSGLDVAALTGGVFQNVRLLADTRTVLAAAGFTVLQHHVVPANDGGLALGQAVCSRAPA